MSPQTYIDFLCVENYEIFYAGPEFKLHLYFYNTGFVKANEDVSHLFQVNWSIE